MSRRIVRIRKKIESVKNPYPNISYYPDENYKIGFIIPVTSRKRKYKNIEGIDFFRILFTSFLKTVDKSGKYKYSFHLGYDDDDEFFSSNKEKIIEHFKNISIDFEDLELEIFLYEIKNLKSKVGEIWSKLAEYASFDNDYLYQIGDDICILSPGWEDRFIGKLISQNNIGVVGPNDINNRNNILTQSFVHVTHLQIFGTYYPSRLKNWYIDNWIGDIYKASQEKDLKVKNMGGAPRYNVENNKKLYSEVLEETKPILEEYKKSLFLEEVVYFKCKGEISFVHENKRFIGSNRLVKYDYEIEEEIEYCDLKERIVEVYKNKGLEKNIHFVTYGNNKYENAKRRIVKEAKDFYNFKSIKAYGPENLDSEFREKFKHILKLQRGGGYWIWKPHIIMKKLLEIKEGEYIVYLDSGCTINKDGFGRFKEYIEMLDKSETPIISFQLTGFIEKWYTNDKIFEYFNIDNESDICNTGQLIGGIQIIKKCNFTIKLFDTIMKTLEKDPSLFTDKYNNLTKRNDFRNNRHDQSIMSVIRKIYGSIILEDETYFSSPGFGGEESLKYPFWATRKN